MHEVAFYRHALQQEDIDAVTEVMRSTFLTTGPRTAAFERAFAEYLGVGHVVGVNSCTMAEFVSLVALGVGPGDEVITTPMTFIATSNAVLHTGADVVFVDVDPETALIDPDAVEAAITPRTKAIVPVHLYGAMADMQRLDALAKTHGLAVIEDAAHAVESERGGARPGHLGSTACFSFYATKNLTCGEGGAIATHDADTAEKLRRLRLHGMSKSAADRYNKAYRHWDQFDLGFKANMSDVQAAMLLNQLPRLASQLERRQQIAQRYEEAFADLDGVTFPTVPDDANSARHLFTIWVDPAARDDTLAALQQRGIGVAVNYRAVHLLTYYRERFGYKEGDFPHAERIGASTITLPLYPLMSDADVDAVIDAVRATA